MTCIATLNDNFRKTFMGGKVVVTAAITALAADERENIVRAVMTFDGFDPGNDPYGERDFGALKVNGREVFWKIDYYDAAMEYGSENPANPALTTRVLTIMLPEDY